MLLPIHPSRKMALHFAFGPQEDDAIIKHRLLTRITVTRGEPPLKKLQKKFLALAAELEKDGDNLKECERLHRAFLQEMNTFELPLLKSKTVVAAKMREKEGFEALRHAAIRQMEVAQADIEVLKRQLEDSRVERRHKEECEAVRRLVATQPPRDETRAMVEALEREIEALEAENVATVRTLDLRRKQFSLLLHVVSLWKLFFFNCFIEFLLFFFFHHRQLILLCCHCLHHLFSSFFSHLPSPSSSFYHHCHNYLNLHYVPLIHCHHLFKKKNSLSSSSSLSLPSSLSPLSSLSLPSSLSPLSSLSPSSSFSSLFNSSMSH